MGTSSSFLYKVIATVEIVSSGVITIFGVNSFLLFNQMDYEFQMKMEMIYYSSIVSVVQSILTILASIILVGCYFSSVNTNFDHLSPSQKRSAQFSQQNSLRRKAIAPTWIAWTLISLASLLFVFIAPIHYCIQSETDREILAKLPMKDGYYETRDSKRLGECHSEAPELIPIRNSLRDLYSFSFIGIMFKTLFIILTYRNWRRELRRGKKIMIYIQSCDGEAATNDHGCESQSSSDMKGAVSPSSSTTTRAGATTTPGINETGEGGDASVEIDSEKNGQSIDERTKKT